MLQVNVSKIENNSAQISLPDGQHLTVPLSLIKGNPEVGGKAYLMIAIPGAEGEAGKEFARNLLNELIENDK